MTRFLLRLRYGTSLGALALALATSSCIDQEPVANIAVGLRFDAVISNVAANATLPSISVSVINAVGGVVSTDARQITILGVQNGSTAITVSGTLQRAAVNGVATFTGLSIAQAGTAYSLIASGSGLASASSNTFTVTP